MMSPTSRGLVRLDIDETAAFDRELARDRFEHRLIFESHLEFKFYDVTPSFETSSLRHRTKVK